MDLEKDREMMRAFISRREHYRLLAEVRALGTLIRELYFQQLGHPEKPGNPEEVRLANKDREEIAKMFEETVERSYAAVLERIEDISPSLAAEMDDRTFEEIPQD